MDITIFIGILVAGVLVIISILIGGSGSWFISYPAMMIVLDGTMGATLSFRKIPYGIRIEGHTDNISIQTVQYPSNRELSTARAVNVVKYLTRHGRIAPQRLSAAGNAHAKPVLPNTSHANRARNRRVEIVLLKGKTK